jgi:hypothetical protein
VPADAEGPYGAFHEAVSKGERETDDSRLAAEPEAVARAIERAISARRPRPRYRVTSVARLLPALHGALPDRAFDRFLKTMTPPPSPD